MNSRSKGNRNERRAASLVSEWTKKKFTKTPASGGLQWKTSFSKGDIVCSVEGHFFPFCIEVKAHKDIDFSHLITPGIKNIKVLEFWDQCTRDAKACNKIPMLLMRYDRLPSDFFFLILPLKYFNKLELPIKPKLVYFGRNNNNLVILDSTEFFKTNYKEIKSFTKTFLKNAKEGR